MHPGREHRAEKSGLLAWLLMVVVYALVKPSPRAAKGMSTRKAVKVGVGLLGVAMMTFGFLLENFEFTYRFMAPQYVAAMAVHDAVIEKDNIILHERDTGFREIEALIRKEYFSISEDSTTDGRGRSRKEFFERNFLSDLPKINKLILHEAEYTQREQTPDGLVSRKRITGIMSFVDGTPDTGFAVHGLKETIAKEYLHKHIRYWKIAIFSLGAMLTTLDVVIDSLLR